MDKNVNFRNSMETLQTKNTGLVQTSNPATDFHSKEMKSTL